MSAILALDLGSNTGAALGRAGDPPSSIQFATWKMPRGGGADVGAFAATFMSTLEASLEGVGLVIFEAPIMVQTAQRKFRPDVVRRFYGMAFVIEGVCALRGIECAEATIAGLKKEFAGHGRAEKEEMIISARRRGFDVSNEHEADAAACWLHAVAKRHRDHVHLYDPDFRLFRGDA